MQQSTRDNNKIESRLFEINERIEILAKELAALRERLKWVSVEKPVSVSGAVVVNEKVGISDLEEKLLSIVGQIASLTALVEQIRNDLEI